MPPKTARKSTAKRRIVRPSDLNSNGEKNDEKPREDKSQVLSKDPETSQSKKPEVEEKSEAKKDPTKETKKETIKEPEKEIIKEIKEEKPAEKRIEEIKAEEKENEDKNEEKMEDKIEDKMADKIEDKMDYEDEEYEPDEETTAVDYEPEENHEEYIEEEIEEADAEDYTEEEPLDDEISNHNDEISNHNEDENEISNHNSDQNENISDDNNSLSGEDDEQHEVVNEHRKRKEFEVFVGGLDKDATESDLKRVFSQAGEITEIRLLVNPVTKKNKGFAFLRFATVEQAKRVVREFKAPVVCGKRCGVAASHDNDTLFVGNICKTWTKEHLKETLKGYGVDNFEELKLVDDIHNEGMNRGFAFLEFSSRDEALEALKRIQKRDVNLGTDRVPKVAFSDSFKELDEEVMSHVSTVFIDHLPPAWDEDKIRKHLKNYGSIQKIELARNMPSAKRRDFGFVTFDTHDHAIACINGISGIELGEGDKIVKLKARLSRPTKKEHRPRRISMMSSFPPIRMVRPIPPRMDRFRGSSLRGRPGPPPRRPGPPPRHFGTPPMRGTLRVAPMGRGSRVVRRVISSGLDSRRALITVTERPPPVPNRFSNNNSQSRNERLPPPPPLPPPVRRQQPGGAYKGSMKRGRGERERGEREYNSSRHEELPPPPPGPPSRRPRNIPSYDDEDDDVYGSSGRLPPPPPYSDIAPRGMNSRASDRRAFLEHDDYGNNGSSSNNNSSRKHHDDRGASRGAPRNYDSVYGGSKRPYSDIDDGPRHGERNPRARLDYSTANNYSDSYNDRMGRGGYGGTGGSRNSLYGNNRQGMNYASGSGRGNDSESMYPSGLSGSYGGGGGGGSYPSVYSNRGLGGGSNSYY